MAPETPRGAAATGVAVAVEGEARVAVAATKVTGLAAATTAAVAAAAAAVAAVLADGGHRFASRRWSDSAIVQRAEA